METTPSCAVCGASDFDLLYNATLKKCRACTHVAANLQVDQELLREVYRENYFTGEEYVDYAREKTALQHNFARRLDYVSSLAAFRPEQRVLEIGCAFGFFGEVLLTKFPFCEYTGFDVVPEACNYAVQQLGLNVRCLDFLDADDVPQSSHIFMWDVIEHLNNPQLYIEKARERLEKGGSLSITTGDISALLPRLQKRRWRMIHPPSHLHYFSKRTLSFLLRKYGFKVLRIHYPSTARSLKQIYYSLFVLGRKQARIKNLLYAHIPENAFISLNTYDIMLVVAEKV
jgi:2-polyprenyl-3-methyl-5-hydroxy-6-metoxy-1,4-benzoquinol methylase